MSPILTGDEILDYAIQQKAKLTVTKPIKIPLRNDILLGYENEENGGPVYLPLMFSTDSTAIIGRKGSGKSTLARKLTEGLIEHDLHPVIIDPLDVWWGLRAAADGKGPGLDVVIFGGSHADLPITEQSAVYIADLVVDQRISAILVLDEMKQAGQRRFVQKFMERIFERKRPQEMRTPLHLVIDEGDVFIPQNPMTPEAIGSLSEVDRAIRHGRSRGLGTTVITQRPAKVNKDVLTQCEVLIALQVTGPQDRKALREWTDAKATEDQAKHFWESLASMKRGQAWVWSPSLLECFKMVNVDLPWTYDSSFTPSINSKPRPAAKLKDLDLATIKTVMATQIEQAKANDPKALRAQVASLNQQLHKAVEKLATKPTSPLTQKQIDDITKAALAERDKHWQTTLQGSLKARDEHWLLQLDKLLKWEAAQLSVKLTTAVEKLAKQLSGAKLPSAPPAAFPSAVQRAVDHNTILGPGSRPPLPDKGPLAASDADMKPSQRKVLIVLAQHNNLHGDTPLSKPSLAMRAGYSQSGSFDTLLSSLRTAGWLTQGEFRITAEGIKALGSYEQPPAIGQELRQWWYQKVTPSQRKVLMALVNGPLSKADLAAAAGYSESGSFDTLLSSLRTLGLLVGGGRELMKLHEDIA